MIIGALHWLTGREPDVIIGKPSEVIVKEALEILDAKSKDSVIIGDQIDIDVAAGKKVKMDTLLVLTGVTTRKNLNDMVKRFGKKPDYVMNTLEGLFR